MSKYKKAGVDIELQNRLLENLKRDIKKLKKREVINSIGSFGGLFSIPLKKYKNPVLVSSCDGVGTKILLGIQQNKLEVLGYDIVCHCVNDILVQGVTEPLFFMDYFGCQKLKGEVFNRVLKGIIKGCKENELTLLGGETAELSGMYPEGVFDLVGFIVGIVEKKEILPKKNLKEGDLIYGLPSTGLHTNGYTLARNIIKEKGFSLSDKPFPLKEPIGDSLLKPHISYLNILRKPLIEGKIKALAHITGGGFIDNIPRVLPGNLKATIKKGSWEILPIFKFLEREGKIEEKELYRVFNMGIGMVLIVAGKDKNWLEGYFRRKNQRFYFLGKLEKGKGEVELR